MTGRWRPVLLGLWAAAVCGVLAVSAIWPTRGDDPVLLRAWVLGYTAFPITAALLLARRPRNTVGRVMVLVALGATGVMSFAWLAWTFPDTPWSAHLEVFGNVAGALMFTGILVLLHVFPTGRPLSRSWARVLAATVAFMALGALVQAVGRPTLAGDVANPFALDAGWLATADTVLQRGQLGLVLLGAVVLFTRYRRGTFVVRAQLRWFLAGTVVLVSFVVLYTFVQEVEGALVTTLAAVLTTAGLWSLPLAVLLAVTRYRLYEIDRILSRTVAYAVLAGALTIVYGATVLALQTVVEPGSDVAVAGSTLVVAALFTPLRRRVRAALDRRFNRSQYNAAGVVRRFAHDLQQAEQVDLDAIVTDLSIAVRRTMQPASVAVWLRDRDESRRPALTGP